MSIDKDAQAWHLRLTLFFLSASAVALDFNLIIEIKNSEYFLQHGTKNIIFEACLWIVIDFYKYHHVFQQFFG